MASAIASKKLKDCAQAAGSQGLLGLLTVALDGQAKSNGSVALTIAQKRSGRPSAPIAP